MKRFKTFLRRNRDFINWIQNISLTVMGILVSIASCEISNSQLELEYNLNKPVFEINEYQVRNDSTGNFDENEILISKKGGIANNINVNLIVFVEFDLTDSLYKGKKFNYNLFNYYGTTFPYNETDGIIEIKKGFKNNLRFIDFSIELENKLKDLYSFKFAFLDVKKYLKITYHDVNDDFQTVYYDVNVIKSNKSTDNLEFLFKDFERNWEQQKLLDLTDYEEFNYDSISSKIVKEFYTNN